MKRTIPWSIAFALAACAPAGAREAPEPFLIVTGGGEARIATDRARLDFMVETQAVTAQEATAQNGDRMDRVIKALRAVGGTTVTVETGSYNLSPVYRQPTRNQSEIPTIETYRVVNHVRVHADDLDRVGGLIDASITAGANRIAGLTFESRDPEPQRLEALRAAVARARSEAETVAEAMGVDLRTPLEVQTSADLGVTPRMPMYRTMEMAQTAAPTPGEQVVRANVTNRYQLLAR
jgi:uncharacterized protein YggE